MKLPRLLPAFASLLVIACGDGAGVSQLAASNQASANLPVLTGRVVDNANLLAPAQEASLVARLTDLERKTTDQFVVVTVPSLDGEAIEEFGLRLGNGWGIGQKDKNNGVLLIVAPNDRKVRIEVGLGLERTLPDRICSEIIERDILPHLRKGRMAQGIEAGVDAVTRRLTQAVQQRDKAA